jgi:hypothetical protein
MNPPNLPLTSKQSRQMHPSIEHRQLVLYKTDMYNLEALSVDNRWSRLVILLLADPHLLEGGEGCKDGSTDPYGVFALGWSDDLDLHRSRSQGGDLLLHTISNTWEHGRASGEDSVGIEVLTDVDVALHDAVVRRLVDTAGFHTKEAWLHHGFRATESFVSDSDDLSVWKLIALLKRGRRSSSGHLLLEVKSDVAELLLDITDNLALSRGGEGVTTLSENLHEVVRKITTS